MRIEKELIQDYFLFLTSTEVNGSFEPSLFDTGIDAMSAQANKDGNIDILCLVFDYLISHPEKRSIVYKDAEYDMNDQEFVELMKHTFMRMFPGDFISEKGQAFKVEFF